MLSTRSVCAVGFTLTLSAAGLVFGGVEDQAPPALCLRAVHGASPEPAEPQ